MKDVIILKEQEIGGVRTYEQEDVIKAVSYELKTNLIDIGGALSPQTFFNFITTADLKNGMVVLVDNAFYRISGDSTAAFSGLKKYSAVRIDDE